MYIVNSTDSYPIISMDLCAIFECCYLFLGHFNFAKVQTETPAGNCHVKCTMKFKAFAWTRHFSAPQLQSLCCCCLEAQFMARLEAET